MFAPIFNGKSIRRVISISIQLNWNNDEVDTIPDEPAKREEKYCVRRPQAPPS